MAGDENETEDGEYLEGLTITPDERKEANDFIRKVGAAGTEMADVDALLDDPDRALVPLPTKPEPERVVPPFPLAAYLVMLGDTPDEYR
jgi:hypothetical protein